jgi:hypothetical protein
MYMCPWICTEASNKGKKNNTVATMGIKVERQVFEYRHSTKENLKKKKKKRHPNAKSKAGIQMPLSCAVGREIKTIGGYPKPKIFFLACFFTCFACSYAKPILQNENPLLHPKMNYHY